MKSSLKKGLQLYASRRFFFLQSSLFRLVLPAILVFLTAQVQMSLQEECPRALGMEDRRIPDISIKASSAWFNYYQATNGRLNFKGGWFPKPTDRNPWFEVSFGSAATVSRVATQGAHFGGWVEKFMLAYSKDGNPFVFYKNNQTFQGNTNNHGIKKNELKPAIDARVIRIYPKTGHAFAAMRVEFYGCRPVSQGNVTGQALSAEAVEVKWQFVGNKKDNSLPCGFKVWYRVVHTSTTNNNTWIKSQTVDAETTDYLIHNLLAYTTYDIYVEALNDACTGWINIDHVAQVTTHEKAPSAPPQNVTVLSVKYNSVVLQWLPPPLQSRNGKLLQYRAISWRADVFINSSVARNYSHDNTTIKQKGSFVGLKSDTNYTVVVTVSNSVGTSPTSSPLFFRTLKVPIRTSSPKTEKMVPTVEATPSTTVNLRKRKDQSGTSYVITGVVLAVAVGLVLVIAIAVYMFKKRRKNKGKRKPKEEQGVIIYENNTTFSHAPNLVDSVGARITHQEQRELQSDHSYYNCKVNVKQNNFSENNGLCASDIYSYANSDDVRCNQSNNEKLSAEQRPMYENNENLGSSYETTDYEEVRGNPDNSSFPKQMQHNAPSNKTLAEYEVMGNLCSTLTPEGSRVNTAQPQMKPEYSNLKGPDPIPMQHSDNVYQHLNKSDTGSGAYECLRKHGSCDRDVSWSLPNQSQADIRNIEEAYEPLATSKMPSTSTNSYYEKLCLSKAGEDVCDSKYENVGDSFT